MLFDYLITTLAQKTKKLVSCEYDAFSKNFNFENFEKSGRTLGGGAVSARRGARTVVKCTPMESLIKIDAF